jgi:hypothetical protein
MRVFVLVVLVLFCGVASADEALQVCYGYGCLFEAEIIFDAAQWQQIQILLNSAVDPEKEREMLSLAIGKLYLWAGEQSPIHNDRGGNYADEGVFGAMDCIDHSTSTTRFLNAIEQRHLLRWHRVLEAQERNLGFIFQHFSAAIEEKTVVPEVEPERFVVDSWFVDNGKPAVILPLDEWKKGAGPDV